MGTEFSEVPDLLENRLLADFGTHDHALASVDIRLKIAHGFIPSVSYQYDVPESGLIKIVQDGIQASGVRGVPAKVR